MNYSEYLEGIFVLVTLLKVKEKALGLFLNQSASRLCKLEEICYYAPQHLNQSPFKDDENAGEDVRSGRPWGGDDAFLKEWKKNMPGLLYRTHLYQFL